MSRIQAEEGEVMDWQTNRPGGEVGGEGGGVKHGSLFAGIGGFDLGFERAGIKTVWQVEIDDYCRKVLAKHFPDAQRFSDIRECGKHNLPWVDILSGGFPCQDISNAGKRAGIDGERSGLWSEYARIIGELRPRYVVVENVAALLGRGMGRVLGDLAACGYDAEWQSIRASDVGAPHRRERIWIVAYANGSGSALQSRLPVLKREGLSDLDRSGRCRTTERRKIMADSNAQRCNGSYGVSSAEGLKAGNEPCHDPSAKGSMEHSASGRLSQPEYESGEQEQVLAASAVGTCLTCSGWWAVEPNVGRVAHGIPARVDRLRGLGNAIVPQISEWIGRRIVEANAFPGDQGSAAK